MFWFMSIIFYILENVMQESRFRELMHVLVSMYVSADVSYCGIVLFESSVILCYYVGHVSP